MSEANVAYTEYLRTFMAMRAAVVELTRAIVNKASTNPPSKGKKKKLLDAVYLEHNKDQRLVVWSYGPGGKACMGPFYPTAEAYPLQAFIDRMLFITQNQEANTPADWMPEHLGIDSLKKVREEYGEAAAKLKKVGRVVAATLVGNDELLPACLTRGQQPEESYAILYLNDGSGGLCPEESKLIRLCGERPTEDVDNYELFLRIYLHSQLGKPAAMVAAKVERLFTPYGRKVITERLTGAREFASMLATMEDREVCPTVIYTTDGESVFVNGTAMTDDAALDAFKTQALVLGRGF